MTPSFLDLIPKVENPQGLEEFRPICLIGSMYKVVSNNQTTFIMGRQILDGILLTNEIIDYAKGEHRNCMLFKVDFAQAYDCVDWNYLRGILKKVRFGQRW